MLWGSAYASFGLVQLALSPSSTMLYTVSPGVAQAGPAVVHGCTDLPFTIFVTLRWSICHMRKV